MALNGSSFERSRSNVLPSSTIGNGPFMQSAITAMWILWLTLLSSSLVVTKKSDSRGQDNPVYRSCLLESWVSLMSFLVAKPPLAISRDSKCPPSRAGLYMSHNICSWLAYDQDRCKDILFPEQERYRIWLVTRLSCSVPTIPRSNCI